MSIRSEVEKLELRQAQYVQAMQRYEDKKGYAIFSKVISVINVGFQFVIGYNVFKKGIGVGFAILAVVIAYLLADFVNGLVHMYMDNNDKYTSIAGPLVASFHLHHRTPLYKVKPILLVYFDEAGSKIWLAAFEVLFGVLIIKYNINSFIAYMVLFFCVFSCIAELSHYLCHVSESKFAMMLMDCRVLLNKRHHGSHHIEDNVNYAFLNGVSDPIINIIAKKFYRGYKTTTDLHYENYNGKGTANR